MNEQCLKAQSLIYELRVTEASSILADEKAIAPENLAIPWLQEYCLFISLFISENKTEFESKQQEWKNYISAAEHLKSGDAWYNFILSDMYLHRATVKLKMNDNLSAGNDIKKANVLLKENEAKFPDFLPDNKNTGLINALFSAVPQNYKWLTSLLGFEGNLEDGLSKIESYLKSNLNDKEHRWLKTEAAFIYSLLQYHFRKDPEVAWKTIEIYTAGYKNNMLLNYMRATIAGYCGRNDEMIDILSSRPSNRNIEPVYYMDYMLGLAKLRRLDDDADQYLKKFTVKFKGGNYIKSAYRYLAWCSFMKDDAVKAETYYSLCIKSGKDFQEEDKHAHIEAGTKPRWTAPILKCRLLFDGHYYMQALQLLNTIEIKKTDPLKFRLELSYRKARIQYELKNYADAILLFDATIALGKNEPFYYAAYSALYMAAIYEHFNNREQAIYYYNKAKNDFPRNGEYRNSIDQKAKLGLKRLQS